MGKIKRARQKYHNSRNKDTAAEKSLNYIDALQNVPKIKRKKNEPTTSTGENMFNSLDIEIPQGNMKPLPEKMETQTISSFVSSKEGTKKDRRKQKRDDLLKTLKTPSSSINSLIKRQYGCEEDNKLVTLEKLLSSRKTEPIRKAKTTSKMLQKDRLKNYEIMMRRLQDTSYCNDPFSKTYENVLNNVIKDVQKR